MKTWIKIILGLALAVIVGVFLFYHLVINKPHPNFEKIKPVYSLNAEAFYKEFKTSKGNASKLYNGKVIEITGKLTKVEIVDTLTTAVFVFNKGMGMFGDEGIRCVMSKKSSPDAAKLKPDGITRIKGYCTGFNDTDVIMEHCSLNY